MTCERTITVVIPVIPGGDVSKVLDSLSKILYPPENLQIIVVEGRNPSHQRNQAAKSASGQIIYFLDNDVIVDRKLFRNVVELFDEESDISVVGGPAVTPESDTIVQKCFGYVLASIFGAFIAREKFLPLGLIRNASEKELVLCNLAIRRRVFEESDGFSPSLYPNEENEFLNRLNSKKIRMVYHPLAVVFKSQRKNFFQFAKQLFSYGRGRAEHFILRPEFAEPVFAVPSLFVTYLLLLPFLGGYPLYRLPLLVYLVFDAVAALAFGLGTRKLVSILIMPFAFPVLHISYGLGFMWGVFWKTLGGQHHRETTVDIKILKPLGSTTMTGFDKDACSPTAQPMKLTKGHI